MCLPVSRLLEFASLARRSRARCTIDLVGRRGRSSAGGCAATSGGGAIDRLVRAPTFCDIAAARSKVAASERRASGIVVVCRDRVRCIGKRGREINATTGAVVVVVVIVFVVVVVDCRRGTTSIRELDVHLLCRNFDFVVSVLMIVIMTCCWRLLMIVLRTVTIIIERSTA